MLRHGSLVMGDEYTSLISGSSKNIWITDTA